MKLRQILIFLYVTVAILEIAAETFGLQTLIYFSKPWLMIILMGLYLSSVKLNEGKGHLAVLIALIFSLFGDVFLMIKPDTERFFLLGLGSFLISHITYSIAFIGNIRTPISRKWTFTDLLMPLLIISHSTLFLSLMYGNLEGVIKYAVIAYVLIITIMAISASARTRDGFTLGRILVLAGAICYLLSDSLIGVSKFIEPDILYARTMIMSLYTLGQFLIIKGWIMNKSDIKKVPN